jgi:hypothetical protein
MRKKVKGQFGGLIGEFAIAVFIVLFVIIFIVAFKIHVIQAMVDYYLWGKEYDIPMALFSIDVKGNSSVIALSRIIHEDKLEEDSHELKVEIKNIVDRWFIENKEGTDVNQYQIYNLKIDNFNVRFPLELPWEELHESNIIQKKSLGLYPTPIVFNGTTRVVTLKYETIILKQEQQSG